MRVSLLLLVLLLAACTDTEQLVETSSDTATDNGESIIESTTEEPTTEQTNEETGASSEDPYYGEDPYLAQVNYDIHLIIEELARRVAKYPHYAGKIEKTLRGFEEEEYRSYTLNYEIVTDGNEVPQEYAFHFTMSEENSNGPVSIREGYHFTNDRSYEMISKDNDSYYYSFDLIEQLESDFAPDIFLTPQALFNILLTMEDEGAKYISMHDEEQALMEISYLFSTDKHLNIMGRDNLLLDNFDRYTFFFNDRIFDFKGDAYIHIMINTNTMLPNAYTLTFEMDSLDVDSNLDIIASHKFDFESEIENIVVPEEFINMAE